jgi:glycerophosphoryl diester phosphodiesterase
VIVRLPEQLDNAEYYKKVLDAGVDGIFMDNFDLLDAYLENQPQNINAMPETQNESG